MVGWHQLNCHEFEEALEDSEVQGSLVCWSPSDTTEQLNNDSSGHLTDCIKTFCSLLLDFRRPKRFVEMIQPTFCSDVY